MSDHDPWDLFDISRWFRSESKHHNSGGGGASGSWPAPEQWIEEELQDLMDARHLFQVQRVARALLGELSFEAGVVLGLVGESRSAVLNLVDLGRSLVLAALYELVERPSDQSWTPIRASMIPVGAASQVVISVRRRFFSPQSWQHAYQERKKLFDELRRLIEHLPEFVPAALAGQQEPLKRQWARVEELLRSWNVDGRFDSGRRLGRLLAEVLTVLKSVQDEDRVQAELPQLIAWTRALGRGGGGTSSTAQSAGGGEGRGSASGARGASSADRSPQAASSPAPSAPAPKQPVKALPKGPPDPNAKARGTPEVDPGASTAKKRDLERQNDSADRLAREGYDIEHNTEKKPNGKTPDYKISGEYADHLNVDSDSVDQARRGVSRKVKSGQADRIVMRLDDSNLSAQEVQGILERKPVNGLKEVIFIKNDAVTSYVPTNI